MDWQELWNGCHVRIKLDRVSVYNRRAGMDFYYDVRGNERR